MRKILLAILVFATSALAADFTGNWTGEGVTSNGESHPLFFVLRQDGNTLTGSGGPDATEQHAFSLARIEGNKITLEVGVGQKGVIHFELKADDGALKGTVELRREQGTEAGTVTMKKVTV